MLSYPELLFQVRKKTDEPLKILAHRLGEALGCEFSHSNDDRNICATYVTQVLGMQITLSDDPDVPEGHTRTYCLIGCLRPELEDEDMHETEPISITPYMLGILTSLNGQGWYIPKIDEFYRETGIEMNTNLNASQPSATVVSTNQRDAESGRRERSARS